MLCTCSSCGRPFPVLCDLRVTQAALVLSWLLARGGCVGEGASSNQAVLSVLSISRLEFALESGHCILGRVTTSDARGDDVLAGRVEFEVGG